MWEPNNKPRGQQMKQIAWGRAGWNDPYLWNKHLWCSKIWEEMPPAHISSPYQMWSVSQRIEYEQAPPASWVSLTLSSQFVRPTAGLSKCCPRAAVDLHCPLRSPLRLAASLLDWTSAGSGTELQSVDVERDITGCNSLTPTRKVTLRLMRVAKSAGYMFGCWKLGPVAKRWLQGMQTVFLKEFG